MKEKAKRFSVSSRIPAVLPWFSWLSLCGKLDPPKIQDCGTLSAA
jgi:hypothetical protein